jgi:hypothetical protein
VAERRPDRRVRRQLLDRFTRGLLLGGRDDTHDSRRVCERAVAVCDYVL